MAESFATNSPAPGSVLFVVRGQVAAVIVNDFPLALDLSHEQREKAGPVGFVFEVVVESAEHDSRPVRQGRDVNPREFQARLLRPALIGVQQSLPAPGDALAVSQSQII